MKVIDTFMFCNELDMLEGRLEYLYDHVDHFVLVEAPITQSGHEKPMHFMNNISRYKKYIDKIIYFPFVCKRSDFDFDKIPNHERDYNTGPWQVENGQRDHITECLGLFSDDSLIFISDCDEIYHKDCIGIAKDCFASGYEALSIQMDHYQFNFENKSKNNQILFSTVSTNAYTKRERAKNVHNNRYSHAVIHNGGWHLSWWLDPKAIQYKIETFAHQEKNQEQFKSMEYINKKLQEGGDIFNRDPNVHAFEKGDVANIPENVYRIFNGIQQKIDDL
jgi:beta-1,4-mannosyl-glycoprotein beta-1,4-N-acetylglucosaminyltransferase